MNTPSTVMPEKQAWLAMFALSMGFFMALMDQTMVAVALPEIQRDLDASINELLWVSSGYLLAVVVPLIFTGRLGDMYGQKLLYRLGLGVMACGAVVSAMAPSIEALIAGRIIQGFGSAIQMPQTMSVINRIFARERRGRALGVWGIIGSVAALLGPIVGGFLTGTFGWHAVFWVPIPIVIVAIILATLWVPKMPAVHRKIDAASVLALFVGLGSIIFAIQQAPDSDWAWWVFALIAVGVVGLILFVRLQDSAAARGTDALVPLELFADRNYRVGTLSIISMGFMSVTLALPVNLWVQDVQGFSANQAGLVMAPMAATSVISSPFAGILVDKLHPRRLSQFGFGTLIVGMGIMWWIISSGLNPWWLCLPAMLLGFGQSFVWGTNSATSMRDIKGELMGVASGVYNTFRQVGSVVGVALVSAAIQLGSANSGLQTGAASALLLIMLALVGGFAAVCFFKDTLHTTTGNQRP
ncbi:DHA2 family efflux MFS transporter permease subunit [Corynebacterium endometrii]|uniref:Antiseptic resistance protein n=1 Tax=Corynebacterium endometrii TaxID=2488819 RepID=A0A4V1CEJ0_9CORY|nr:DHA2 family efflux MFS transporter permease subunit [Corynebacterium endometrii]QCB28278.1 Antiseptic resistance protein [Corynebacterium endometrii]